MAHPLPVPIGATAQRPRWEDLPRSVQAGIESRLGHQVVAARSQGSGYTPGFASRLVTAGGATAFVKGIERAAHPIVSRAYDLEAARVVHLPAAVPAPRLRWSAEIDGWVVLAFDDVGGRHPRRPWQERDLAAVLEALAATGAALQEPPPGAALTSFATSMGGDVHRWDGLAEWPALTRHAVAAKALAANALDACAGPGCFHSDLRDDNLIIGADGRAWLCDWGFLNLGAPWIDVVTVLLSVRGDGIDVDPILSRHPSTAGVDGDAVDSLLALLAGYFLGSGAEPELVTSPHLRAHQRWYAAVTWGWLAERRRWVVPPTAC